jgi:hypothetical protein
VQALAAMRRPTDYFQPALLPLTNAPTLVLFAEREDAVLDAAAPVRLSAGTGAGGLLPSGQAARGQGAAR